MGCMKQASPTWGARCFFIPPNINLKTPLLQQAADHASSRPAPLTRGEGFWPEVPTAQGFGLQRAQLGDEQRAVNRAIGF